MRLEKLISLCIVSLLMGSTSSINGGEKMNMEPYQGSEAFEKIKSLVGNWEGTSPMSKEGETLRVKFDLTSNGSAVIETSFPGMPHEMVSVYHDEDGKLVMTHYCSLGNQPKMSLMNSKGESIVLSDTKSSHKRLRKETHMHALTLTMKDSNKLVEEWTNYEKDKKKQMHTITLTRQP